MTRGPYDLTSEEREAAESEAAAFAATIKPWPIPAGHGTYREKRPGLGVQIHGYDVDCTITPHRMTVRYTPVMWRTPKHT